MEVFKNTMITKITKKAQTGGLITGLIFGVASLVIGVIIAFVITSTMMNAGLLEESRPSTQWFNKNTTLIVTDHPNGTSFGNATLEGASCSITNAANNNSEIQVITTIEPGNFTVNADVCTVRFTGTTADALVYNRTIWTINATTSHWGPEELSANALTANFTEGVDNVSTKIPTVLLVAAIVLILGVLALLVAVWQRMRVGGGSI